MFVISAPFTKGLSLLANEARQFPGGIKEVPAYITGPQEFAPLDRGSMEIGCISTHGSCQTTEGFRTQALRNNRARLVILGRDMITYGSIHVQPDRAEQGDIAQFLSRADLRISLNNMRKGEFVGGCLSVGPAGFKIGIFYDAIRASKNQDKAVHLKNLVDEAYNRDDDIKLIQFQMESIDQHDGIFTLGPPEFVGEEKTLSQMAIPRTSLSLNCT